MADPARIFILEVVVKAIKEKNLLDNVLRVGKYTKEGIFGLTKEFPDLINSSRGRGLLLACNARDGKLRDQILESLKRKGKCVR